ncbi:MAG: SMI1/KNR4 family protein [Maricaulaceae bacterium]
MFTRYCALLVFLTALSATACTKKADMYHSLQFSRSLKNSAYADIEWNVIETDRLKPFVPNEDRAETRKRKRALFENLYGLLETEAYGSPLKISLYLKANQTEAQTNRSAAIFYFDNKLIVPTLFQNSPEWASWQTELADEFDGTVLVHITPSGSSSTAARIFGDGDPYENTGAWIIKGAPKDYTKRERRRETDAYIKPFINTKGTLQNPEQIETFFRLYAQQNTLSLQPAIDDTNIYTAFEGATSYAYPPELKVIAQISDGAPNFASGYEFLSAANVYREWKNWKDIYEDWSLEDLTGNNETDRDKTLGVYTHPYWVPFMHDGAGNFIAIDYAPNIKGASGQIIAFGADAVKVRYLAKDMTEFLRLLSAGEDVMNYGFK